VYYATDALEVVFHVATRIPNNIEEKQFRKVRRLQGLTIQPGVVAVFASWIRSLAEKALRKRRGEDHMDGALA
jgi:hypothetical protein